MNEKTIRIGKNKFRTEFSFTANELRRSTVNFGTAGISYRTHETEMPKASYDKMIEELGWSANPNVYQPEVTADNIAPKPEDFVHVPFRLLTATIVAGGTWRATDFSKAGVLKKSTPMLANKPVYLEHDTNLENSVGLVLNPKWSEEQTMQDGTKVPAGIDGTISIDAKTNPKIARGVLMGAIHSNSVTIVFDWEPSHSFANEYEFQEQIGKWHSDGTMVRRIATVIHTYYESSLVFLGADPYAKLIDKDGNLVHIDSINTYETSFSREVEATKKLYTDSKSYNISSGITKEVIYLSSKKFTHSTKTDDMNKEAIAALKKLLGLADDVEITPEHIAKLGITTEPNADVQKEIESNKAISQAAVSLMKAKDEKATDFAEFSKTHIFATKEDLDALQAEKTKVETLTIEKDELAKENTALKAENEKTKGVLDAQRTEVEKAYRLSCDNKPSEGILSLIKSADYNQLEALGKQYNASSITSLGASCAKCGSTELKFQNSVNEEEFDGDKKVSKSIDEIRKAHGKKNVHI